MWWSTDIQTHLATNIYVSIYLLADYYILLLRSFLLYHLNNQITDVLKFRTLWFLSLSLKLTEKYHRMRIKKSACLFHSFCLYIYIKNIFIYIYLEVHHLHCLHYGFVTVAILSSGKTSRSCVMVIAFWLLWTSFQKDTIRYPLR